MADPKAQPTASPNDGSINVNQVMMEALIPSPRNLLGTDEVERNDAMVNNMNDTADLAPSPFHPATTPIPPIPAIAVAAAAQAIARRIPSPTSSTGNSVGTAAGNKKKMSPGETSARQKKKKTGGPRITLRCRVKITRKHLWPILRHEEQREVVKGFQDSYNFYGRVISGNNSTGYVVRFDLLPSDKKDVNVGRKRISVVVEGEEERPFDRQSDND
jgi:hypothetical protein